MLQALRDDVIVKPVYQERIGKLFIPGALRFGKNSGRGEFQLYHGFIYGVVEAIGANYKDQTFDGEFLQVGDKILWVRHEGQKFNYQGQEYIRLKSRWVQAKINL